MQMELLSKDENALAVVRERAKPTLMTLENGKIISSSGRWNDDVMVQYMLGHGGKWVGIGDLAAVAFHSNNIRNKKYARKRLSTLFRALLGQGQFLIVEYTGPKGAAQHCKLADLSSKADEQAAVVQLEKRRKRKEVSEREYDRAITVLMATRGTP